MTLKKRLYKLRWQAWEYAYSASWHIFGQMPITWDIKHRRNMAFTAFQLLRDD